MTFVPAYGFQTSLTGATAAGAGLLQVDPSVATQLGVKLGGGNYTYAELSDGLNFELIQITGVSGTYLNAVRGQLGTLSSAFPVGACVRFVWTSAGIAAVASASTFNIVGGGATAVTFNNATNTWSINTPLPTITATAPAQVLGAYPQWQFGVTNTAGNCCCGGGTSGGGGGTGTPLNIVGQGIVSVQDSYPNYTVSAQGVNLQSGSGISVTGTYPNFTIAATGGGGGSGVSSVSGSSKILVSGAASSPVISLNTTGVGAQTYNGLTIDQWGTITEVDSAYVPVTSVSSGSSSIVVTMPAVPGTVVVGALSATTTQSGTVKLAESTAAASNNSTDTTSAVTPAGVNAVIASVNSNTITGTSSFTAAPLSAYTNILSSTTANVTLSATQKALIVASVSVQDTASTPQPWGFGVFKGTSLVQGLQATPTGSQTIQCMITGPLTTTTIGLATTALPSTATVIGQSVFAIVTSA